MIETLRIRDIAIVDQAEIEFGPGLNVLTGETGAGKSIVLGALGLLAGGRAAPQTVRDGSDAAAVEALFRTEGLAELEAALAMRGLEVRDHELVVRRTVTAGGRSRAQLAGQLVPVSTLAELFAGRIEVSSQHDSQALRRPEVHGQLLDRVGGLLRERGAVAAGYQALRALEEELELLRAEAAERERRRDVLAFQVREIDEARLDAAELEETRAERSRLAHAERLREGGAAALALLAGDPVAEQPASASDLLSDAARRLASLARLDPALGSLAERLAAAQSELRDAAVEIERYVDAREADPDRLAGLEARLQQVESLQRKYGATVEEVLQFRERAAAELAGVEGADRREAEILGERERRRVQLEKDASALSSGRARAAARLGRSVQAALRGLAMREARFAVQLEPAPAPEGFPCGPAGREVPEFAFSANAGEAPRPLRRVASGGELSRVFLALKNAAREAEGGMVLVFDEVDAGISGRAADRVGRALAELAGHHQVLCITHLPQVAAFAARHFRVWKRERKGRTLACISRVEGAERVEEIARMAGGEVVGEATRRHARALLGARQKS